MTLGWVIFWIFYVLVAAVLATDFIKSGSANRAIDKQLDSHKNESTAFIVIVGLVTISLAVILWPLFLIYAIYHAIKEYIRRKKEERLDPIRQNVRAALRKMDL